MASQPDVKAGGAFIELYVKGSKAFEQSLKLAEQQFKAFSVSLARITASVRTMVGTLQRSLLATGRSLARIGTSLHAAVRTMGTNLAIAGAVGTAGIGFSVKTFAQFEATMSEVKAMSRATADDFVMLTKRAEELGKTTRFSASQVAEGMKYMAMAGFKASEVGAGIKDLLNLAQAGNLDLGLASDIATDISTPFGIAAKDISRVGDVLARVATSSNTTVEQMGYAFQYLAASAASNKQSLEDMGAALAVLANNGQKASMAGTQLRGIMLRIADNKIGAKIKALGVVTTDAAGNMRPLLDILVDLNRATSGMGGKEQFGKFAELFGARAATGAIILGQNAEAIKTYRHEVNNAQGAAAELAKVMSDNLMGDFVGLWSAIEGVQIALGKALMPTLRELTQWITGHVRNLADWISQNQEIVVSISKIAAGVLIGGAALMTLGGAFSFLGTLLAPIIATVGAVFTVAASGISIVIAGLGLFGAVAVAKFTLFAKQITTITTLLGSIIPVVKAVLTFFTSVAVPIGTAIGSIAASITTAIGGIGGVIAGIAASTGIVAVIIYAVYEAVNLVTKIVSGFIKMVQGITSAVTQGAKRMGTELVGLAAQIGKRFQTIFVDLKRQAVDFVESFKMTFKGVWSAFEVGDFQLAMKILWSDLELRFAQGKEFISDFVTEMESVFARVAEVIRFNFTKIFNEIKTEFYGFLLKSYYALQKSPLTVLPSMLVSNEFTDLIRKEYIKADGAKEKATREVDHEKRLAGIKGADWNDTNAEIEAARTKLDDQVDLANAQKWAKAQKDLAEKRKKEKDAAWIREVTPGEGSDAIRALNVTQATFKGFVNALNKPETWADLDPVALMTKSLNVKETDFAKSVRSDLLFAGSAGSFSAFDVAGGGMNNSTGAKIVSVLEDIKSNTDDLGSLDEEFT